MPSIAITRKYEACYILKPESTDDQINATIQRYRGIVEKAGGTVEKTGIWERRKLAYEIKGYNEGVFVLLVFTGVATVETELRRVFQISSGEDQIRYMIVKQEDGENTSGRPAVELTERIQRTPPVTATAAPEPERSSPPPVAAAPPVDTLPAAEPEASSEFDAEPVDAEG
ncbi:MAG: 30S ribosomal protein S6 [Capsulimonadaceae bacterium]